MNKKSLAELREVANKIKDGVGDWYPVLVGPNSMLWLLDKLEEQERAIDALRKALEEAAEDMSNMADNICHYVEYGCLPTAEEVAQACVSAKQIKEALRDCAEGERK